MFDVCAPSARRHFLEVCLVNDKARIFYRFLNRPSRTHIKDRLYAGSDLKIDVLHAGGIKITFGEHSIRSRITVEAAKNDMIRFTDFLVFASGGKPEMMEGKRKSEELKMKLISG